MVEMVIDVRGLTKTFESPKTGLVTALDAVDLTVPRGTVLGLLGHNGAGKTTLVNVLSTLTPPTSGSASVAGHDVVTEAAAVRARIGLTGQFATLDEGITGRDNLVLLARLYGASRRQAAERAAELLAAFDLTKAADRPARGYSGGMRRRLDLAACLVAGPEVIFLDEPTTGLDPGSRRAVWAMVESLVAHGSTVLLTTQYLEEADRLADAIVVLAGGRVVARGSAAQLKRELGQCSVTTELASGSDVDAALGALRRAGLSPVADSLAIMTPVATSAGVTAVVRALDSAGAEVTAVRFAEPSLDDVYLHLTPADARR
ncbi:ATP-binding cassette domain-containing protein [Actinokineospora guangxiensis]|uniref:ATP-binding cassette domain-containing protein n=1 Tax=Actinokineospora guangxiensis TaxID=1490288 RepID=A0ABW0EM61_9PSEU